MGCWWWWWLGCGVGGVFMGVGWCVYWWWVGVGMKKGPERAFIFDLRGFYVVMVW